MKTAVQIHNDIRKDGRSLIQIRVSHKGRRYRRSSEIYVKKTEFDPKAKYGYWVIKHLDREALNEALKERIRQVERTYQLGTEVTPKAAVMGDSFFYFAENFYKKYDNEDQRGTYDHYRVTIGKLKSYAGANLKFSEITVKFINDFIAHLKTKQNKINTIGFNLKKIRAVIRQAVIEDIVPYQINPFNKIKIETQKTSKEKLTAKELALIRKVVLEKDGYQFNARNIFLFCVNTMGMRVGSALALKNFQIQNGMLHYQMNKGGKPKNIQLTAEAKRIHKYYFNKKNKYLFPYLENCESEYDQIKKATALINKALPLIAGKAKINKHVTSHVARHSLTYMAIEAGVDMRTLQGMLNHSSVKTTEIYAGDIADVKGNEALKKIFK